MKFIKKAGDVFYWDEPILGGNQDLSSTRYIVPVRAVASVAQLVVPLFTVAHSDSFAHNY